MQRFFLLISVFVLSLFASNASADNLLPQTEGERINYSVQIDFGKAYLSGVGILALEENRIIGYMANEFGLSLLSFEYLLSKDKVKLIEVAKPVDKWYIRKVMRKDLKQLMHAMENGEMEYRNPRHNIQYKFLPLENNDTQQ